MAQTKTPKEMLGPLAIDDPDISGMSISKLKPSGASEGQVIQFVDGEWVPVSLAAGSTFVDAEVPQGVINGTNDEFTLEYLPAPPSSLQLFRGGVLLSQGVNKDYTVDNKIITFNDPPQVNDVLVAYYRR